jgi:Holliday junction resolvase RusA-like endonuclease
MLMIEITIPITPVPWQPSRKGNHCFYDPKEKEKRCARYYIREQYEGQPLKDYTILFFHFYFKPPKSLTKKQKEILANGRLFPTRCDCTNLQKLYEDCLKGIVIEDDRKVVGVTSQKNYGDKERTEIKIFEFAEFINPQRIELYGHSQEE